jgi:hypothetical protein
MNKKLNETVTANDQNALSDTDLDQVSGGLLPLVIIGFVLGLEIGNAVFGGTRKAH